MREWSPRRREGKPDRPAGPSPVSVEPAPSPLVDRARRFLADGPAEPVPLIEHVCQLPGAPKGVAERMATALFTGVHDVDQDAEGRWFLVREELRPVPLSVEARSLDLVSFAVVDVETTGGGAGQVDRITDFGAVIMRGGRIIDQFETLVNPMRSINPAVSSLTRITWNMVRQAPTFRDVAPRIAELLRGHVFVAHNATFDWRMVSSELAMTGAELAGERLCTVKLARAVLPRGGRRSLDALSYRFGIENHARHRAGGDAAATAKVLVRLLELTRERGCDSLEDVFNLMRRPPGRRKGRGRRRAMPGWSDGEVA